MSIIRYFIVHFHNFTAGFMVDVDVYVSTLKINAAVYCVIVGLITHQNTLKNQTFTTIIMAESWADYLYFDMSGWQKSRVLGGVKSSLL